MVSEGQRSIKGNMEVSGLSNSMDGGATYQNLEHTPEKGQASMKKASAWVKVICKIPPEKLP